MQEFYIENLDKAVNSVPCAVALGNFDGVHMGHATLLSAVAAHGVAAVFTFSGEVRHFLTSESAKKREMAKQGVALYFSAPFPLFRELSPEAFVDYLVQKLGARHIVCGYNFRFGKNAVGTPDSLVTLATQRGVAVTVLPEKTLRGETVSSSRIRALLAEGKPEEAASLLGRPYALFGKVTRGHSLGKKLSFPTVNLPIPQGSAPLKQGVYASTVCLAGKTYPAVTNIGNNPTFDREVITCETYIFAEMGELYGEEISVQLLSFLREERKFTSPEALKEAIAKDVANAVTYHSLAQGGGL